MAAMLFSVVVAAGARAQDEEGAAYEERVKATLEKLLSGRDFRPTSGCDQLQTCIDLIDTLRHGAFAVVEPIETSDRPNMAAYRHLRQKCTRLDLVHFRTGHRWTVAMRNFAMYRLDIAKRWVGGDDIYVFRAQHYVPTGRDNMRPAGGPDLAAVWPGMFVAVGFPSCREYANATAQEGDWLAKHNPVGEDDYLSEIIRMGDRYFVVNLDPIAGPGQPKSEWWYDLQLWDWGPHADADLRRHRHIYAFSYRPVSVNLIDPEHLGR